MSNIHRIRILTELGELAYRNIEDLNLYFSRIVDDYSDIGAKFGDFSYEFNLPITKQNSLVLAHQKVWDQKIILIKIVIFHVRYLIIMK